MCSINYQIRPMKIEDYDEVRKLWMGIHGFGIRSMDDSKEGVTRFLLRNPALSMVAVVPWEPGQRDGENERTCAKSGSVSDTEERIVGAILCGHDGRRGCLYHVCVHEDFRKHGIGKAMATACMRALQEEGINKVNLIAFKSNEIGNRFWKGAGWEFREDLNYYDFTLNEANITRFNE